MPVAFEVRLRDTSGSLVDVATDWTDLQWSKRVNGLGWYRLSLYATGDFARLVDLDYQVEIYRSRLSEGIAPYLEFEGVHRTPERQRTAAGESMFTSYGRGYLDIITRRIMYPAGHARTSKSGPGETVIKEFVDENAGPNALVAGGRSSAGVAPGLTIQPSGGAGAAWQGERSMQDLITTIQEIADQTSVDFELVGAGPAAFDFRARASPLGADRSVAGLDRTTGLNAAGYRPVLFSELYANVEQPDYIHKRTEEFNVVAVLGQGLEADREIVVRSSAATSDSPWNIREMARQASFLSATQSLKDLGDAELKENQGREEVTVIPIQQGPWLYGRDYFLGDIVTVVIPVHGGTNIELNRKIVAVTGQSNASQDERINVELAELP